MHKLEVPSQNITIEFPENISELNQSQYLYFLKLVLLLQDEKIDESTFKIKLSYKLLGLVPGGKVTDEKTENVFRLAELMESFIKNEDGKRIIDLFSVQCKIPEKKLHKTTFIGPGDVLSNITFGQFVAANTAYADYTKGDKEAVTKLAAALYLPKGERFNASVPKEWKQATPGFLFSALLLFQNTIEFISTGPILYNGIEVDFSILFQSESQTKSTVQETNYGFQGVLFTMAESGVFGTVKQTQEAPLYDVLLRLHQVITQAKETENATTS